MLHRLAALVLIPSFAAATHAQSTSHFDGKSWWEYVKVLAGDNMEGRDTGSPGLKRAEQYVVEQLKKNGLEAAGRKGYYQTINFVSREIDEKNSSLALVRDGVPVPLTLGEEAYISTRAELAPRLEAPLVFVGYGLRVPEKNYDDVAGLALKGKVVVLLMGSPAEIPAPLASHYQSASERWKAFRNAGAVGMVTILNPASMDIPWSRISANRTRPSMDLAYPEFHDNADQKLAVVFNPEKAELLFAGSGHTFAELAELAKDRKPLPRFPLKVSIAAKTKVKTRRLKSANIVAKLPGSDPQLRNQYIVLSAHLDHVGIGAPINGDRIYNGAMDNGSGSALLLDMAASLKSSPEKLRRSVLFLFVTGEEKGLLGSRYYAAHPTVDGKSIVADLNTDMFLPIVPLKVLRVLGLGESDLGDRVSRIAEAQGVIAKPDPEPLRNSFIRSDQYNFIRHGIPSLAMSVGFEPGSPEQKIFKDWLTQRYHAPSDDVNQPVDLSAAAKYEEIMRWLLISVANDDKRPEWKAASFFKRYEHASGN